MPEDYFGRLLARHAPGSAASPGALPGAAGSGTGASARTGRVLVQPRLPGPFERIEALGGAPAESYEPAPLYPRTPPPSEGAGLRFEREVRTTERETTVLRAEAAPPDSPQPAERPVRPAAPLLRPAAHPDPGVRPAAPEAQRPGARRTGSRPEGPDSALPATAATAPAGPDAAPRQVAPALRPRTEVPTARDAARAASIGRRGQRSAERVVHVQIGRLEVSAAGAERPAAGAREAGRPERRGPAMSLTDFLARGERTS